VAPKIDRRNLRTIKVREGEPISLDVKVSGEPPPDVSWTVNGKIVSSGNGLKRQYYAYHKFCMKLGFTVIFDQIPSLLPTHRVSCVTRIYSGIPIDLVNRPTKRGKVKSLSDGRFQCQKEIDDHLFECNHF
jgi:hypothetical protein